MINEIKSVAFEGPKTPDRGYTCRASYLKEGGDALIEIFKYGIVVRSFLFPAYKIYNIQAHFKDIVDSEIEKNTAGYEAAAWNGISNATIIIPDKLQQ
jgi:hypothetical protein